MGDERIYFVDAKGWVKYTDIFSGKTRPNHSGSIKITGKLMECCRTVGCIPRRSGPLQLIDHIFGGEGLFLRFRGHRWDGCGSVTFSHRHIGNKVDIPIKGTDVRDMINKTKLIYITAPRSLVAPIRT
jgi:hypothetical protein